MKFAKYVSGVLNGIRAGQPRKILPALLVTPAVLLAVMGLVFCWITPANASLYGPGSHFFFSRQLCWTINTVLLAAVAYSLGWRRWLKAAPFIAFGWLGLVVYAATCPLVRGHWGWISVGCFRINVVEFLPVVFSLLVAWFVQLSRCRAIVGIGIAALMVGAFMCCRLFSNPVERDQLMLLPSQQKMAEKAGKPSQEFLLNQCVGAVKESHWFGKCDVNTRYIPESTTTSMPAVSAVLFGKWYLIALGAVLGVMGIGIGLFWVMGGSESMRAYALVWGALVLLPAFLNLLGCVGIVSMLDFGIPFACYGGSLAMATGIGLAILLSHSSDCDENSLTRGGLICAVCPAILLVLMAVCGVLGVSSRGDFTYMGSSSCEKAK